MRVSEAALALITRVNPKGETEYLTQWNEKWQAYSLIGGHREGGESFRDCCIREIEEELGLQRDIDFTVSADPIEPTCEFTAFSKSAGTETQYRFVMYAVELSTGSTFAKVAADPHNCWLTEQEVQQGCTGDQRQIAAQVQHVLRLTSNSFR